MASTDTLTERPLALSDMTDLMALVTEAGWNQTEADWRRVLAAGHGRGVVDAHGRIIASAVTLAYGGRIGWIGMVLVAGRWRRRGLATRLMEAAVQDLLAADLVPGLDATPAGETVYAAMGFSGTERLTRWRRGAPRGSSPNPTATRVSRDDLDWVADLDAQAFGAERRDLIAGYLGDGGAGGWRIGRDGFLLERPGRTAHHLGPLVAQDTATAIALLGTALAHRDEALLIDAADRHKGLSDWLEINGFTRERPFLRMYLGKPGPFGDPDLLMAAAGPELG